MAQECRVYVKPAEVTTQLARLGLVEDDLASAIRHGDDQVATCTDNDPRVLKNFMRWGKTFRGLADKLKARDKDWTHEELRCLPVMTAPDGSFGITVSSGDARTGQSGAFPKTRNPKGPSTKRVVEMNHPLPLIGSTVTRIRKDERQTWFLLYFIDKDAIWCELSLAAGMGDHNDVAEWWERIILTPLARVVQVQTEDEEEDEDAFEIIVEPRGEE